MEYSPHIIFVQRLSEERDKFNRVVSSDEEWEEVCRCRCDDNADTKVSTLNSLEYIPRFHVVAERTYSIHNGDRVRIYTQSGEIRGEGKADNVRVLNYLDYTDLYVQ